MKIEAIKKNQHYEVPELDSLNINKDRVTLYFDYESYLKEENASKNTKPDAQPGTLQATFNRILGENAKQRANISIGEDQRLHMDALWDKYGQ